MQNDRNRLLYNGYGIFIQPETIDYVGGRACAQLLQQIHYLLTSDQDIGIIYNERKWIYNTIESWADILHYSGSTIKNCIRSLKQKEIIMVEKLSFNKSNRTNFYTINYEKLNQLLDNKIKKIPSIETEEKGDDDDEIKNNQSMGKNCPTHIEKSSKIEEKDTDNKTKNDRSVDKNCPMYIEKTTNENIIKSNKSDKSKFENFQSNEFTENFQFGCSNFQNFNKKNNIPIEMLKIWNETINSEVLTQLNKKRSQFMMAAFKNIFQEDLEKWKKYCQMIVSSDFLMGKTKIKFKVNLDWALKFENIQKIIEGQYGVDLSIKNNSKLNVEAQEENNVLEELIHKHPEKYIQESFKEISSKISTIRFKSWFKNISVENIKNGIIWLKTESRLALDFIKRNFTSEILFSFNKFNKSIKQVEFYT